VIEAEPPLRWHIVQRQCAIHLLGNPALNSMLLQRQRPWAGRIGFFPGKATL